MHALNPRRLAAAAAALTVAALALGASPALANDWGVTISSPRTVTVGKPLIIRVTGQNPIRAMQFPYWLSVVSIRGTVMAHCPANSWDAKQVANATGGAILVMTSHEVPDPTGRWEVPVGATPFKPGRGLLCAYTDDGEQTTLARAERTVTVIRPLRRVR